MSAFVTIVSIVAVILFGGLTAGLILSRLYTRASKEISFVRTGMGGQKVILNGGAMVLPVLHEVIPVNMNTLRLEVMRANGQALITKDRMRVDVQAEFYVRVQPTADAIAAAAQTLGQRTMHPDALKELVEGKFVDALRAVAAEMAMEELHEQRVDFVQKVQTAVSEDLLKNGLELETVSLTGLDQTKREYFNPQNAFDAEGLTRLTEQIEERRKQRNDIEQNTSVAIRQKDLEAEREKLNLGRDEEFARLQQQREVEIRRAEQSADIAREQAEKRKLAQQAQIVSKQEVDLSSLEAKRKVEEQRISMERMVRERDIERERTVELAEQDRAIAIAEKSRAQSEAQAEADHARAVAVKAEEEVVTVREAEKARRQKTIELIKAAEHAERDAIAITVAAEAEHKASEDQARAVTTLATAEAEKRRIEADGEAQAVKLAADAAERRYAVDAEGKRALNEASNILSAEQIAMQVKLAIVESLPAIIAESVKPMQMIDDIKIMQVGGLTSGNGSSAGSASADGEAVSGNKGSLADEVVRSALQYRAQAPLVDNLLSELGMGGSDLSKLTGSIAEDVAKPEVLKVGTNGSNGNGHDLDIGEGPVHS